MWPRHRHSTGNLAYSDGNQHHKRKIVGDAGLLWNSAQTHSVRNVIMCVVRTATWGARPEQSGKCHFSTHTHTHTDGGAYTKKWQRQRFSNIGRNFHALRGERRGKAGERTGDEYKGWMHPPVIACFVLVYVRVYERRSVSMTFFIHQ